MTDGLVRFEKALRAVHEAATAKASPRKFDNPAYRAVLEARDRQELLLVNAAAEIIEVLEIARAMCGWDPFMADALEALDAKANKARDPSTPPGPLSR